MASDSPLSALREAMQDPIQVVKLAIELQLCLRFDYSAEHVGTERRVIGRPGRLKDVTVDLPLVHRIVEPRFASDEWFACFDFTRGEARTFRYDRIVSHVALCAGSFKP